MLFVVAVAVATLVSSVTAVWGSERVLWEAEDPKGDDFGPGCYTYPTNPAFAPFHGLFDVTRFRALCDDANVYFETSLAEISNPWNSQEGFSHALIDIYIDTMPGEGRSGTLREGANVSFDSRYAWDVNVRLMPWGGSRVYLAEQDGSSAGRSDGLFVEALPDGKTIRATVPRRLIGDPRETWKYYVLVASQDGYGPDGFRPVVSHSEAWVFGGGSDLGINPNVLDILAPYDGPNSQAAQLGSWNEAKRQYAVLVPANAQPKARWAVAAVWAAIIGLSIISAVGIALAKAARDRRRR